MLTTVVFFKDTFHFKAKEICIKTRSSSDSHSLSTNVNHKGLQRTANEYAEERRIYKDLISKNDNVDI